MKNGTCYYFDDITKIEDFDYDITLDEKSNKNILVNDMSYKTLIGGNPLRIRFDKADKLIRVYDRTRYSVLLAGETYDFIYNRIRYLIGVKSTHNYAKVIVDSYDTLLLEKNIGIGQNKDQFGIRIKITRTILCLFRQVTNQFNFCSQWVRLPINIF